jgi:hypothetical protein
MKRREVNGAEDEIGNEKSASGQDSGSSRLHLIAG